MTLKGEALTVWLELSKAEQKSYKEAKAKIIEQMGPMKFTSMDNFHHCRLFSGEYLCMLDLAMLEADATTQKWLLTHQFLTGIPVEVNKQLHAVSKIDDINKLIQ